MRTDFHSEFAHPQGYGFNLHAERDKPGQYIGLVDDDSPAATAGLRVHDRIVEVNGDNIEQCTHQEVIAKIKVGAAVLSAGASTEFEF